MTKRNELTFELPKKRGRPKDLGRRQRILQTARDLFLQHGFQAVSVDSIADVAQVSNRTVFSHFASKEQLLWAIIQAESENARPQMVEFAPKSMSQYRKGLSAFGIDLVTLLSLPNIIQLGNLMLSESRRHPELARKFYQWGPSQTRTLLALWIELGIANGWLSTSTPSHAGDHLLALWLGSWHLPLQLGLQSKLTRSKIESHVKECVELFLKAFRAD